MHSVPKQVKPFLHRSPWSAKQTGSFLLQRPPCAHQDKTAPAHFPTEEEHTEGLDLNIEVIDNTIRAAVLKDEAAAKALEAIVGRSPWVTEAEGFECFQDM